MNYYQNTCTRRWHIFAPLIKVKWLALHYCNMWTRCSHYIISLQKIYVVVLNEVKMDINQTNLFKKIKRLCNSILYYIIQIGRRGSHIVAPLIKVKVLATHYHYMWTRCSNCVISLQKIYVVVLNEVKMDRNRTNVFKKIKRLCTSILY